jgi:hypothetical protein
MKNVFAKGYLGISVARLQTSGPDQIYLIKNSLPNLGPTMLDQRSIYKVPYIDILPTDQNHTVDAVSRSQPHTTNCTARRGSPTSRPGCPEHPCLRRRSRRHAAKWLPRA